MFIAALCIPAGSQAQSPDVLERTRRLNAEVIQLYEQGRYQEAVPKAQEALALREQALGANHPDVGQSVNNLAVLLQYGTRDYAGARPLYERALRINEQALGSAHVLVGTNLNNLAGLLVALEDYAGARPLYERALRIHEQELGPTHPTVAASLNNLAALLYAMREYAAARPLHERALRIRETALGPNHPAVGESLNNLATVLGMLGDYAEARPLYVRAVQIREQALGATHPTVGMSLNGLGVLLQAMGDNAGARPLHERALRIRETALGPDHPDVGQSLNSLGELLQTIGDYAGARPRYERALRIRETALRPNHPDVAETLHNLASLLLATGDYVGARPLYERALRINEQALGPSHPTVGTNLNGLGLLLKRMGDYAGARPLYVRAVQIREQALGATHPTVGTSLNNLAVLLEDTGDYAGARSLYERALRIRETALGPNHPDVALSLNNLAGLLGAMGDYATARPLLERALRLNEQALGPTDAMVGTSLNSLATLLYRLGDYAGAWPLFERALRIRETALGPSHPDLVENLNNLAALRRAIGDFIGARPLYERALRIGETALGPNHPTVGLSLNTLAALLEAIGDDPAARLLYERARKLQLAVAAANVDLDDEALRGTLDSADKWLRPYARLLAAIAREPTRDPTAATPAADAFLVAEQGRGQSAQRALVRAGARATAADAATANLARQVQDLRARRDAARTQFLAEYGRPAQERDATRVAALQQEADDVDRDLTAATTRLRVAFPLYGELASPEPIDASAAQRLLRPDEALISLFTFDDRVLVWLLRPGRALVYRDVEIKRKDLEALVAQVRRSTDQSANRELAAGRLVPFDVAAAHALYRLLLAPLAAEFTSVKHLIVVPDETLLPLPFGVLVTKTDGEAYRRLSELSEAGRFPGPVDFAEYAKLPWLAREHAITVLPSATSLRALRQIARVRGTDIEPFIGFGDPVLHGHGAQRGGAMVVARSAGVADALRGLASLPGTRDELGAIAAALGADPTRALYLGARATKPELLALDGTGRLGKARVLSFATHGLLTGQMVGLRQPGLVLTPPAQATAQDDGLLSLDDIVALKLPNTEWVVLSACNTGAGDGSGEALSGLARAFFFAGAPTLLVSHWSVDDRATARLMTLIFERWAKNPALGRSEALRQGMLGLMTDAQGATAHFAHPFAWAAFSVVGEGQ